MDLIQTFSSWQFYIYVEISSFTDIYLAKIGQKKNAVLQSVDWLPDEKYTFEPVRAFSQILNSKKNIWHETLLFDWKNDWLA